MEGNGPSDGVLVSMDVIIAGTNPLAADMVAASVMGFEPGEIPTFVCRKCLEQRDLEKAAQHGMNPPHASGAPLTLFTNFTIYRTATK